MNAIRILLVSLLCVAAPLSAGESDEKLDALVDRVVAAYGGAALTGLRNYEIVESYVSPNTGQSWHPALTDIGRFNLRLVHDLENGRLYQESWFNSRGGRFPNITIVDGEQAWAVNLLSGRYRKAPSTDPHTVGGVMRTTDPLLALEPLDLDFRREVTAHNARVYSDREFYDSVKAYRDYDCPDDRPLCSR
jgi:hypothetical protein